MAGAAVHLAGFGQKPAAHAEILVRQDHVGAGTPRRQRRHEPGRPRPDHQNVAEGEGLFATVRTGIPRQPAQPRRAPDQRFIDLLPEGPGPHEGLVVETRSEEGRGKIVHRKQIELQRWPPVLAVRLQPVEDLLHGGAQVRLLPRAAAHGHQRVGLLAARRQDAARAVILEGPPHQPHAVGQQGRGQRVALEPLVPRPVEGEGNDPCSPQQAPARKPHPRASPTRAVAITSWVTVSRVTTSHAPQPPS